MSNSPSDAPGWAPADDGSPGETGTEGGVVVRDEEHPAGARITLECDAATAPFAITCGLYGFMVHTRWFATRAEAEGEYALMRAGLEALARAVPRADDPELELRRDALYERISAFVDRFP